MVVFRTRNGKDCNCSGCRKMRILKVLLVLELSREMNVRAQALSNIGMTSAAFAEWARALDVMIACYEEMARIKESRP